jgi:hypothetical protein
MDSRRFALCSQPKIWGYTLIWRRALLLQFVGFIPKANHLGNRRADGTRD